MSSFFCFKKSLSLNPSILESLVPIIRILSMLRMHRALCKVKCVYALISSGQCVCGQTAPVCGSRVLFLNTVLNMPAYVDRMLHCRQLSFGCLRCNQYRLFDEICSGGSGIDGFDVLAGLICTAGPVLAKRRIELGHLAGYWFGFLWYPDYR